MTHAILIFTFSPIQSFIREARRVSDLYVGSKILSRLACAVGLCLKKRGELIYPANPNIEDTPNKLVALVPFEEADRIAKEAEKALQEQWVQIVDSAYRKISRFNPQPDETWLQIWKRQRDHFWEIYWVVQKLEGNYQQTVKAANTALDAVKRVRIFEAVEEDGMKDSLSGRRSALRVADDDAKTYWEKISSAVKNPSLLRGKGNERLDTLGAVKRFCEIAQKGNFSSVSMVATTEYVERATNAKTFEEFRESVESLLDSVLYRVRNDDKWPYDGDLFFMETLTSGRLGDSYGLRNADPHRLQQARNNLSKLYKEIGKPSPYYAVLQLDGDSMGKMVDSCETKEQHRKFSQQLSDFAATVRTIVQEQHGVLIYNGGDDVLALAPLEYALPLAYKLSEKFREVVKHPLNQQESCTMSAGIAVAHHLYPLDAVLSAAHRAEKIAKELEGKNAVCVRVLKRSGETFDVRSPWHALSDNLFNNTVDLFREDIQGRSKISSRLAYDLLAESSVLFCQEKEDSGDILTRLMEGELRRLLNRHRNKNKFSDEDVLKWIQYWSKWAMNIPGKWDELARWLVLARFVAQGGNE